MTVRVEHHDGVDHVWLDSPATRNALSLQVLDDLRTAVGRSATSESRALVLDHAGPAFSAGVDVKERRTLPPGGRNHSTELAALYDQLWSYPKPMLCRVDGAARGGALGLLVCADAVVAGRGASFAFSEVRVGVAPALVGALAATKLGAAAVGPWLLTGEPFGAAQAAAMGLVTHLVPGDSGTPDGTGELLALVEAIGLGAPGAQVVTKSLLRRFSPPVSPLLEEMTVLSAALFEAPEGQEGLRAFAEKRAPSWVPGERTGET